MVKHKHTLSESTNGKGQWQNHLQWYIYIYIYRLEFSKIIYFGFEQNGLGMLNLYDQISSLTRYQEIYFEH